MDVREKLVELLKEFYGVDPMYYGVDANALADHLIAHGVTVQEWIPATERLPGKNRNAVLIALRWDDTDIGWYDKDDKCWQSEFVNSYDDGDVTHWMPLPKRRKENEHG